MEEQLDENQIPPEDNNEEVDDDYDNDGDDFKTQGKLDGIHLDCVEGLDGYTYKDLKTNVYTNLQLNFNVDYIKQLINSYSKIETDHKLPPTKVPVKPPKPGKQNKPTILPKYFTPKPNTYGHRDLLITLVLEVVAKKIITGALNLLKESKMKCNRLESRDIHIYIRQDNDLLRLFSSDPFLYEILTQIDANTANAIKAQGLTEFPPIKLTRKKGIYKLLPIKACDINKMLHKIDYPMSFQTDAMSLLLKLLNTLFQYILMKSMRNNQTSDSSTILEDKIKRILGNGLYLEVTQKRSEIESSISREYKPEDKVRLTFITLSPKCVSTFTDVDENGGYSIYDQLRIPCYLFLYNIRNPKKPPIKIPSKDELLLELQKLQLPEYVFVYNSNIITPHDRLIDLGIFTHGEKIFYMPKKTYDEIQIVDARRGYTAEPRKIFKMSDWRPKDKAHRVAPPNRNATPQYEHDDFTTQVLDAMTVLENAINSLTELYSELNIVQKHYDGDKELLPANSTTLKGIKDTTHTKTNELFEHLDKLVDQEYVDYENKKSNPDQGTEVTSGNQNTQ